MIIKFVKKYACYPAGQILNVDDSLGEVYVETGKAVEVKAMYEPKLDKSIHKAKASK
jgi:hypothetical protein